jgi:preprotein translocase subunit SecY
MKPVRMRVVAVIAGLLAALYVVVSYTIVPVPDWAVALFGGPERAIDRYGGLRVWYRPAPGQDEAVERYILRRSPQLGPGVVGDVLPLEFPGMTEAEADELVDLLAHGGLVMKEALETDYATQIGPREDVELDVDQWYAEDGPSRNVAFLRSSSLAALQAATRDAVLAPGTEIAFERVDPGIPDEPYWRTYLLASEVLIDASMIAGARPSQDPNTYQAIVLLDFTEKGGERFCELTGRLVGKKLATLLGGRIRSAPIIIDKICGGRASVTMGGSDPRQQEREARALAAVLAAGDVPEGAVERQHYVPAADVARAEWLARIAFGLAAALVFALGTLALLRVARPQRATTARVDGGIPWRRVAVTALAPIALIAGTHVTLPYVNEIELEHIYRGAPGANGSIVALGITPVLFAFLLVELVALALPRLRWRRHDPRGRVRLGQAVAALAIALAFVQGWFVASYLEGTNFDLLGRRVFEITMTTGTAMKLLLALSLAAGTFLLVVVAGFVREHGLGNGYAALLASSIVIDIVAPYAADGLDGLRQLDRLAPALPGVLAIACATWALLRWRVTGGEREPALRLPASGVAPLAETTGIVYLIVLLSWLGVGGALLDVYGRIVGMMSSVTLYVALVLVSIPIWAWLFARPRLIARVAMQAGLDPPRMSTWLRAALLSVAVLAAIALLGVHAARADELAATIVVPLNIMIVTAAILDIADDLRARRRALAPAGVLHQAQYIGVVERVLQDSGIPVHFHASHVRTLFAFFGPWAPIVVLVPAELAETARTRIDDALRAPHTTVPTVRVVDSAAT